jgi:DNA-binding CsgD family transcriptional regulator
MPTMIRKFVEWLSYHPTTEEIGRALATDYLAEFAVRSLRFGRLNSDDSITNLGQFGFPDADEYRNRNIPSDEWRSYKSAEMAIIAGISKEKWTPDSTMYVNTLRDRGVLQGHVIVQFHNPVPAGDKHRTAEAIDDLCVPLALYLSFMSRPIGVGLGGVTTPIDTWDSGSGQLSQRQLLILRGMVEGKTNHELATELGFSVSTIRHETMRIYQALSVSDRKEAAKKALMLSLV